MARTPRRDDVGQRDEPSSMFGELVSDPRGRAELAAAELALDVQALIRRAFEENPNLGSELAELLGVTENRIALIRDGDGNVSISTLAKVMSATGKRVRFSVEADGPAVDGA